MNDKLRQLIQNTTFLSEGDKDFLISKLVQMSPLEKLRIQHALTVGKMPGILEELQKMRAKFYQESTPKETDVLSKIVQKILPPAPPQIQSFSIFSQPFLLGNSEVYKPIRTKNLSLVDLSQFYDLEQLSLLKISHFNFDLSNLNSQKFQNFLNLLEDLFESVPNIHVKRNYFINFLQSPLFTAYLHTGLTALQHTELQPRSVVLNTLYQIDSRYLNSQQFKAVATTCNFLRNLCGL